MDRHRSPASKDPKISCVGCTGSGHFWNEQASSPAEVIPSFERRGILITVTIIEPTGTAVVEFDPQSTVTLTTSLPWQTPALTPISYPLTSAISTTSMLSTVTLTSSDVVSSPSLQTTSIVDKKSNPKSPPIVAAIIGGTIGAVTLLALLLTVILVRSRRRKQKLSITPFNLHPTAEPMQIESRGWLKSRITCDAVRPINRGPVTVQLRNFDSCLAEDVGDRSPSALSAPSCVDLISSHLPNDNDTSASTVARRRRAYELEKLYPHTPHTLTSDHYRHHSGDNWVESMVGSDSLREPNEGLPAYRRSVISLKSKDGDDDDNEGVPPSSHPSLP